MLDAKSVLLLVRPSTHLTDLALHTHTRSAWLSDMAEVTLRTALRTYICRRWYAHAQAIIKSQSHISVKHCTVLRFFAAPLRPAQLATGEGIGNPNMPQRSIHPLPKEAPCTEYAQMVFGARLPWNTRSGESVSN